MMGVFDEICALYGQKGTTVEKSKSAQKCTDKTDKTPPATEDGVLTKPAFTDKTPSPPGFVSFVGAESGDFAKKSGVAGEETTLLKPEDETAILAWLSRIDEVDPAAIDEVLWSCRCDPAALAYFIRRAAESTAEN